MNNYQQSLTSDIDRYDIKTITNLLHGNHDPTDRLPYSMLIDVAKGRDYAKHLLDSLIDQGASKEQLIDSQRFLILHIKVIEALCKHYDESRLPND